ncbi:MAG: hypothetical protein WAN47_10625 [Nitrosotalea sp.]
MKWVKKGLIFESKGEFEWMKSYASLPIADRIKDDLYRIYFSGRDSENRASIGYLEIDIKDPRKILKISEEPVVPLGKLGTFDDNGAMTGSLVTYEDKKYLYYVGWNLGGTVPFRWSIGLAISHDNGVSFKKYSDGPIIDRNTIDPYFAASPWVIREDNLWRMWYISGTHWERNNGEFKIPYHIRYAESRDGIHWERNGVICVDFKENETRIGKACILKEDGIYKMWYSHATKQYRIGYSESRDGIHWERKDEQVGIDVSSTEWDSEMMEYSFVFKHNGTKYMLYNGNEYGKTGFGYAVME